jgi:hypothetical protein
VTSGDACHEWLWHVNVTSALAKCHFAASSPLTAFLSYLAFDGVRSTTPASDCCLSSLLCV